MTPKQKRNEIKRILPLLNDNNRRIFMRMYSHLDLNKDINLVVDEMPAKQLSWALIQVQNTYYEIFAILKSG